MSHKLIKGIYLSTMRKHRVNKIKRLQELMQVLRMGDFTIKEIRERMTHTHGSRQHVKELRETGYLNLDNGVYSIADRQRFEELGIALMELKFKTMQELINQ
jgi:hypothetical protein